MGKMMKAAVLYAPGKLIVEKVDIPRLDEQNNVLIKVKNVGICGSDLDRVMVTGTYSFPTIPGHEFCGEIAEINGENSNLRVGDRVVVAPIIPCGTCDSCVSGNYGQCDDYDYIGSRRDGAMAEYVAVPSRNVLKMPDSVSFAAGAAVEPAAVTLHGMKLITIVPGDSVAVTGCGTIGLFAIQFARIMGATKIIAIDIDDEKLEFACKVGATDCVNSKNLEPEREVRSLTGGAGVAVSIETAGLPMTQEQCFRLCRKKGRILLLGTAHKDVILPPKTFERIIRSELTVKGSWNSFSAPFPGVEWRATLSYAARGQLDIESMITHHVPLDETPDTIRRMKNREFAFNKVVIDI